MAPRQGCVGHARTWFCSAVEVKAEAAGAVVLIGILDGGPGIRPSQWERLVIRGERGSSQMEDSGPGPSIVADAPSAYGLALDYSVTSAGRCILAFEAARRIPARLQAAKDCRQFHARHELLCCCAPRSDGTAAGRRPAAPVLASRRQSNPAGSPGCSPTVRPIPPAFRQSPGSRAFSDLGCS